MVRADTGATVLAAFDNGHLHECVKSDLTRLLSLAERINEPVWNSPLEVINRVQAEAICSINDAWGVFARSRIELLPHQLWVCREVNKEWPICWLVADDVGLGKTIEAGIILTPLLASGRVKRLLILCPASLVEQWQHRMRTMFDIRLAIYSPDADTSKTDFWHTHHQIIVSLHTLRTDHKGRHDRLLEADPWDLLLVDESHHLNADEKAGPTLAYQLAHKLVENRRVRSLLFFTGTPHRGKTYGFLALLQLLRPDLFDPSEPLVDQLPDLKNVIIRNNKYNVTDLHGKQLFQEPKVSMETYAYSEEEQVFYDTLTDFIRSGRAYASKLAQADQSAVVLVLIAMQKLASSSVAAIRRAISGRLARIARGRARVRELMERVTYLRGLDEIEASDEIAVAEEQLAEQSSDLQLMEDEEPALKNLLNLSEIIRDETKIAKILEVVERQFPGRSILFFTEYKATQSLLLSALIKKFGEGCTTFINGDNRADEVTFANGTTRSIRKTREEAACEFNAGKVRFLVSTEAGGEGIDLQDNCHTLIHVDLPWNPMRLHQRVGRLNRYGQKRRVEIISVRNPSTVESRIWDKLDEKLARINEAFAHFMESPEDLKQLILGTSSPRLVEQLLADAVDAPTDRLSDWFDERAATLGGQDVVQVVQALVGSVHKFDFRQVSSQLPRVDLQDLRPFFEAALTVNSRQWVEEEGGISFLTPEEWCNSPAVRQRYSRMMFDRLDRSPGATDRLLGVGHKAVDEALMQARARTACIASIPKPLLARSLIVTRIEDRVTDGTRRPPVLVAVAVSPNGETEEIINDWKCLLLMNELPIRKRLMRDPSSPPVNPISVSQGLKAAMTLVTSQFAELVPGFRVPDCRPIAILWASPDS